VTAPWAAVIASGACCSGPSTCALPWQHVPSINELIIGANAWLNGRGKRRMKQEGHGRSWSLGMFVMRVAQDADAELEWAATDMRRLLD
jgi:hypothetical protein